MLNLPPQTMFRNERDLRIHYMFYLRFWVLTCKMPQIKQKQHPLIEVKNGKPP